MTQTALEKLLEEKLPNKYPVYVLLKNRLLEKVYPRWCGGFKAGNDHGPGHIKRVLRNAEHLLGKDPLKHASLHEIYLTLLSILYHDVGIVQSRKGHGELSADILHMADQKLPELSDLEAQIISASVISHSSSKSITDECQALSEEEAIEGETVRPRFVAALVRLADELDEDVTRAPRDLELLSKIPDESHFYWRFCQRITGISIKESTSEITINVEFAADDAGKVLIASDDKSLVPFVVRFTRKLLKIDEERKKCNQYFPDSLKYKPLKVNLKPGKKYGSWKQPRVIVLSEGVTELNFLRDCAELLREELPFWTSKAFDDEVSDFRTVLQALRSLTDLSEQERSAIDAAVKRIDEPNSSPATIGSEAAEKKKKTLTERPLVKFLPEQLIDLLVQLKPFELENRLYRHSGERPGAIVPAAEFTGTAEEYIEHLIEQYSGEQLEAFVCLLIELALVQDAWSRLSESAITKEQCLEEFYRTVRSYGELPDSSLSSSGILGILENLASRWPRKDLIHPLSQLMLRLSTLPECGVQKEKVRQFAYEHFPKEHGSKIVITDFLRRLEDEDDIDYVVVSVDSLGSKPSYMRAWLWRRGTDVPIHLAGISIYPQTEAGAKLAFFDKVWTIVLGNSWLQKSKMVIEFLLPRTLFHWPIDRWKEQESAIGHNFPVILRWKDRKQTPTFKEEWLNWYRSFCDASIDVEWLTAQCSTDQISSKVQCLEFAPTRERGLKNDALTKMLDAGVAVAAWPRVVPNDWTRNEVSTLLKNAFTGKLKTVCELPRLRRQMKSPNTETALAVLFDTPIQFTPPPVLLSAPVQRRSNS